MARGYDFSTAAGAEVEPLEAVGVSYECWRRYGDSTYFVVLGRGVALGRLDLGVFHGCLGLPRQRALGLHLVRLLALRLRGLSSHY